MPNLDRIRLKVRRNLRHLACLILRKCLAAKHLTAVGSAPLGGTIDGCAVMHSIARFVKMPLFFRGFLCFLRNRAILRRRLLHCFLHRYCTGFCTAFCRSIKVGVRHLEIVPSGNRGAVANPCGDDTRASASNRVRNATAFHDSVFSFSYAPASALFGLATMHLAERYLG